MTSGNRNARFFWPAAVAVVVTDVVTKALAVSLLETLHAPRRVVGDILRFALLYNPGAAFGINVGAASRYVFLGLALLALVVLWHLYRSTSPDRPTRALALGLIMGGAVANIINRLWSARGVVDFIDVGIGGSRWPAFNVADIGISVGAALLAWTFWRDSVRHRLDRPSMHGTP